MSTPLRCRILGHKTHHGGILRFVPAEPRNDRRLIKRGLLCVRCGKPIDSVTGKDTP